MEGAISMRGAVAAAAGAAVLALLGACAPADMTGVARRPSPRTEQAPARKVEARIDTASSGGPVYNLETEMPEKAPQRPAQLIDRLEPVASDTFSVQDIDIEEKPKQLYDIGYRIQVFASNDRTAAERVKQRVIAETRMPAYIDYEDGLYKVRAGDFTERKEAAQAGAKLAGAYPGWWIVRTTIRKAG